MAVERQHSGTSLIDVLDRVLDKGIVIDAWVRVSVVGIDLITVEARVVVASIETYLRYSEAVSTATSAARPAFEARPTYDELEAENVALRAQILSADADRHVGDGLNVSRPERPAPAAARVAGARARKRPRRRRDD
jgi:hypothetical protein